MVERTRLATTDHQQEDGRPHKRSKSGGILGTLSFLKSKEPVRSLEDMECDEPGQYEPGESSKGGSPITTVLPQSQGRQRKGSLRQAAMAKMRERSGSLRKERAMPIISIASNAALPEEGVAPRPSNHTVNSENQPYHSAHLFPGKLSDTTRTPTHDTPPLLESSTTSPGGPYASTTDEDDHLSFYRPAASSGTSAFNIPSQGSAMLLTRRRSTRSEQRSLAAAVPTTPEIELDEEWDYSETEWWGWVVLTATWIVFVVGMGSCLGVWSWAWDVGETPYAPPDLEDDDTLPITGYYPALMVCTAVMAWVWVVVAWVGMKYFRHAKVGVDG